MKTKQIIVTINGQAQSVYIAADAGVDKIGNKGFVVYSFPAKQPEPTDIRNESLLIDTIFKTEDEALKEGEKIVKEKVKVFIANAKKELAKQQKTNKRRK
jgi:hypothetical protein